MCSRQIVNFEKSTVYFSKNTFESYRLLVARELGVRVTLNPEKYLSLPNIVGRQKKTSFQNLKDRMKQRING